MCYQDKTFCKFYDKCKDGKTCHRALNENVLNHAIRKGSLISQYLEKPDCFKQLKKLHISARFEQDNEDITIIECIDLDKASSFQYNSYNSIKNQIFQIMYDTKVFDKRSIKNMMAKMRRAVRWVIGPDQEMMVYKTVDGDQLSFSVYYRQQTNNKEMRITFSIENS